jgi:hypothetical protein
MERKYKEKKTIIQKNKVNEEINPLLINSI